MEIKKQGTHKTNKKLLFSSKQFEGDLITPYFRRSISTNFSNFSPIMDPIYNKIDQSLKEIGVYEVD